MAKTVTFLDAIALLWRGRRIIGYSIAVAVVISVVVSLLLPPRYDASVMFMPAETADPRGGMGMLGGRLSDLADLAGLATAGGTNSEKALAVLSSRDLTYRFLREERVVQVLFEKDWDEKAQLWKPNRSGWFGRLTGGEQGKAGPGEGHDGGPPLWDAFRVFDRMRSVVRDRKTGMVTLTVSWRDPVLAAKWANRLVERTNEDMRTRATQDAERSIAYLTEQLQKTGQIELRDVLFRLSEGEQRKAMLAHVRRDFAFEVVDPAVPPKQRSFPRRKLFVLSAAFVGLLVGLSVVLSRALFAGVRVRD